jgi:hypothetical protein
MRLQRGQTAARSLEPQVVEQTLARHDLVRVQEQIGKESALTRASEPELLTP